MPPCAITRVEASAIVADELGRLRDLRRVAHLVVGGVLFAVADVLRDGAGEEDRLLRHEADLRAQLLLRHLAHVHAVHQDAAAVDVVEARNQVDQGGLARAGAADDRGHLARAAPERDIRDARAPRRRDS